MYLRSLIGYGGDQHQLGSTIAPTAFHQGKHQAPAVSKELGGVVTMPNPFGEFFCEKLDGEIRHDGAMNRCTTSNLTSTLLPCMCVLPSFSSVN